MLDCTIIIPHKPTVLNDEALELNLKMILKHTNVSYELIIDTECPKDPYQIWNEAAKRARSDTLVFTNSDVLFGPGWDILVCGVNPDTIVSGYLVEPGNVGVAAENIHMDFGMAPSVFDAHAFEEYVTERLSHIQLGNERKEERGWYMPCAMNKYWFNSAGGFPTEVGFPNPNDAIFWDVHVAGGTTLIRVPSFAYHFQALSNR
jgi:hypothetical protein